MKKIKYHRVFKKNFKKRIEPNKKLLNKFKQRLEIFVNNPSNKILKPHQLKGKRKSYWSFSITGDIRVIYKIEDEIIKLYDIGTHNQVY